MHLLLLGVSHKTAPVDLRERLDFSSRDRKIWDRFPIWVSFDSSAGLLHRSDPTFQSQPGLQTGPFTERTDLAPRVMTAFDWKGFHLVPSFSIRETNYSEAQRDFHVIGQNHIQCDDTRRGAI